MYSVQKHVADTHTPSSLCSLGILLSLFSFFPLVLSCSFCQFRLSFLEFSPSLYLFLKLPARLPFHLTTQCIHTPSPIANVSYPATAGLIMLHTSIHSFYTICSKAESFMSHSNLGQGCSKSLSWLKKNPVLHEIMCLMFSICFALCCKSFFDTVLHHLANLRFPWSDLL